MEDSSITEEDCMRILQKCSENFSFLGFSIKSLAEDVEGYLSSHFSLTIHYTDGKEERSIDFFMKKPAVGTGFLSDFAQSLDVFNKECFVFKLCDEVSKLKNFKIFAPKGYLYKDDVIVMENLTEQKFYVAEKNVLFNLEECKISLKTLALYHASFIAYEEQKSIELSRKFRLNIEFENEFEDKISSVNEDSSTYKFFAASVKLILDLVDVIPDKNLDKERLKQLIEQETDENPSQLSYLNKYRQCTLHCDLWSKNIMFKKTGDVITDCRLVDFQLLRYFLPGFDLVLFLNANASLSFRKEHRETLIRYYYTCLESQLKDFGVICSDLIPFQDLLDGVIISEPSAKMQAFNDTALMNLPSGLIEKAAEMPELYTEVIIDKRSEYIIEVYKENEEFRKFVIEDILELNDSLEKKQYFINNMC